MSICIALAFSATVLTRVPDAITLAWQHTVEHSRVEEDYQAVEGSLSLNQVRTDGFGAGLDLPADAIRVGTKWHYQPKTKKIPRLLIRNSLFPDGYELCWATHCSLLSELIGNEDRLLSLAPCDAISPL